MLLQCRHSNSRMKHFVTLSRNKAIIIIIINIVNIIFTGQMVYTVRQRCGKRLAIEAPTDADVVSTVPESATPAALGYAQQVCLRPLTLPLTTSS